MTRKLTHIALALALSATAQAQDSLRHYMALAIKNNPQMAQLQMAYHANDAITAGANTLPDPELSLGFFPKAMEHVGGKQVMTVQLMQMWPWFGTLKANKDVKQWRAKAAFHKMRQGALAVIYNVQRQWYELLATQAAQKSILQNIALLKDVQQVALYKYKAGTAMRDARLSDQLRIEAELATLEERRLSLDSQMELQRRQFNLLLHRDERLPVALPDTIVPHRIVETSWEEIVDRSPELAQTTAESEAFKAEAQRAKLQGRPMMGLGIEYMVNKRRDVMAPGVMPGMNGMNMWMPMLKLSLPIYTRKTSSAVRSARMMQAASQASYALQMDKLRARYLAIAQQEDDARRKIRLYAAQIRLLNNTLQLMQTEYANGATSLSDILQTLRERVDYALKLQQTLALHATIVAQYEEIAGQNEGMIGGVSSKE